MKEIRKKAYRTLIYQAFLDLRISTHDQKAIFHIAYAFHNLAEESINDFDTCDEESFWNQVAVLEERFDCTHYRKIFRDKLLEE